MSISFNETALYQALGWCGCSSSRVTDAFNAVMNDMLDHPDDRYYTAIAARLKFDEELVEIILLELTRLDVIEHGTAVRGSWPCSYHNDYAAKIQRLSKEPNDEQN